MRYRILVLAVMLLAAACGGTDSSTAGSDTTSATPVTDAPAPEGPPAPDFSTTLSDGSEFTLADHGKPVYLVFWAEW